MAEIKLGNKYDCFNCGTKFYDLGRGSAVCPKCAADQKDASEKGNPAVTQAVRRRRRAELAIPEVEAVSEETDIVAIEEADGELVVDEELDLGTDEEEEEEDEEEEA